MPQPSLAKDHSKNKQEKNRNRHEKGKATKKRDQGGEKGDARRNVPKPKSPPTQPPKEDPKYLRPGPKPKAAEIPGFKPGRPGSAGYWE
jgi:hypothetical protein